MASRQTGNRRRTSFFGKSIFSAALFAVLVWLFVDLRFALGTNQSALLRTLSVSGKEGWVDSGFDVEEGDRLKFRGEGEISLQKGNPEAKCGPDGSDIRGIQQPLPEENLGCLIGKVVQVLAVRQDEKTKKEVRDELVKYFAIGRERDVMMPLKGRLYLGINENVVKDNDGQFTILIFAGEGDAAPNAASNSRL